MWVGLEISVSGNDKELMAKQHGRKVINVYLPGAHRRPPGGWKIETVSDAISDIGDTTTKLNY